MIFRRYWKLITLAGTLLLLSGSMYFLYQKNIDLEVQNSNYEQAVEASKNLIGDLTRQNRRVEQANIENQRKKDIINSELQKTQAELRKLANESKDECINRSIGPDLLDRM